MLAEVEITRTRDMDNMGTVFLDPDQKSPRAQDFDLASRWQKQHRACALRRGEARLDVLFCHDRKIASGTARLELINNKRRARRNRA